MASRNATGYTNALKFVKQRVESDYRFSEAYRKNMGTYTIAIEQALTIADSEATDDVVMFRFPAKAYLTGCAVEVDDISFSDDLVFDLILKDGATETVLLAASTLGQAGGEQGLSVLVLTPTIAKAAAGRSLVFRPSTPSATGLAGTLTVTATFAILSTLPSA